MPTHNNWFNSNISERLKNSSVDLKINIKRGPVKNLNFHAAADYTSNIIKDINKPIYISYSGGLDSEYVVKCFMRNNIPINVVILKTEGNKEELQYAYKFCKENYINPIILNVSENEMLKVYYQDIFCKLNGFGENSVASLIVGRYVKEQDGIVILGEHILDEIDNKINLGVNEWDFYNDAFIDNTYYFFIHTPEILYAMIKDIDHTDAQIYKSKLYDLPIRPKMKYDHYSSNYYKALREIKKQRKIRPNVKFCFDSADDFINKYFNITS